MRQFVIGHCISLPLFMLFIDRWMEMVTRTWHKDLTWLIIRGFTRLHATSISRARRHAPLHRFSIFSPCPARVSLNFPDSDLAPSTRPSDPSPFFRPRPRNCDSSITQWCPSIVVVIVRPSWRALQAARIRALCSIREISFAFINLAALPARRACGILFLRRFLVYQKKSPGAKVGTSSKLIEQVDRLRVFPISYPFVEKRTGDPFVSSRESRSPLRCSIAINTAGHYEPGNNKR